MTNKIIYNGKTYQNDAILSASVYSEVSPITEELGFGTLEADLVAEPEILNYKKNAQIVYTHGTTRYGTYYLQEIQRIGRKSYRLNAVDAVGLLSNQTHYGGIYTLKLVPELVAEICGDIAVEVETSAQKTKLSGWLPVASRRDNLQQVLFATGFAARIGTDGKLHIGSLSQTVSSTIRKVGENAAVKYPAPVTKIKVTEHSFLQDTSVEPETLFEGETQGGRIQFSEPYHSLQAAGITIQEQGANYAVVSAGTGTLTGKKYVHAKREVERVLSEESDENEVTYSNATLVTGLNADGTADRLFDFFQHQTTIQAEIRLENQRPGDLVKIVDPYGSGLVEAYLETSDITISGSLKAAQSYRVGYIPYSHGGYTNAIILTGSGTWTAETAGSRRVVLIGGGQGGNGGHKGADGEKGSSSFGESGAGGQGGAGGLGGKILTVTIPMTQGQSFSYRCGTGGTGGAPAVDENPSLGTKGGATTFGTYSSADGGESNSGHVNPLDGIQYAMPGASGVPGQTGQAEPESTATNPETVRTELEYKGVTYYSGTIGKGESYAGNIPGSAREYATGGLGGGPAAGGNGEDGKAAGPKLLNPVKVGFSQGGAGADAVAADAVTTYGCGGTGGPGGGGGGGGGMANITFLSKQANFGLGGAGGSGGQGGAGAPGCIIIYS